MQTISRDEALKKFQELLKRVDGLKGELRHLGVGNPTTKMILQFGSEVHGVLSTALRLSGASKLSELLPHPLSREIWHALRGIGPKTDGMLRRWLYEGIVPKEKRAKPGVG